MRHLPLETAPSPEGHATSHARDAISPAGDLLESPNFGICDTTRKENEKYAKDISFDRAVQAAQN